MLLPWHSSTVSVLGQWADLPGCENSFCHKMRDTKIRSFIGLTASLGIEMGGVIEQRNKRQL